MWCSVNWKSPGVHWLEVVFSGCSSRWSPFSIDCVECVDGGVRDCYWVDVAPQKRVHLGFGADVCMRTFRTCTSHEGNIVHALGIAECTK
jgi:hypothetical protein